MGVGAVTGGAARAVFLDRDGVLNRTVVIDRKPYPPRRLDEFVLLPGVASAISDLKQAGFLLIVTTNQPDVARGKQSRDVLDRMHERLREELPVDEILVCCHDDEAGCDCRKPLPGLMLSAAQRYGIQLWDSFVVGDRWRDVDAGHAAGCNTLFVDYGYDERLPKREPTARIGSLREAADWILARQRRSEDDAN
ncbi:MAG: D-glycero-alpha-D-manno-heptose-1,7-bisphosphate 7-phosphatase [Bryobacteraceae bacterium]